MSDSVQPTPLPYRDRYTDTDFDDLCWHDNYIHGIAIRHEEFEAELVLDIDFVVGCTGDENTSPRYWLSPASLTFQGVTDLKINIDWASDAPGVLIHCASMDGIARTCGSDSPGCGARSSPRWRIDINWPRAGIIEFRADGFVQILRSKPILWDCDLLPASQRPPFA